MTASVIGLFAWSPWAQPTEDEWLGTYAAWFGGIESSLGTGAGMSQRECESTYDGDVGEPPNERLEPASAAARRACAALSRAGWRAAGKDVVRALTVAHSDPPPRQRRDLSEIARSSVGVRGKVYCWHPEAWAKFSQDYELVRGGEEVSPRGVADTARGRIDLGPDVCTTLDGYLRRIRPAALSNENLELAEALVVLTHQAEHLKAPTASEVDVECYAVQHVRPLVQAAGWGQAFATEIALHAWELSYTQLPPQFRTQACRNGGPLDRNPRSNDWP